MARKLKFLGSIGDVKWVGFRSSSITGERKEFWWWTNAVDLDKIKRICGALLAQQLIEAQVGPAVDLSKSSADRNHIETLATTNTPVYGIYIEKKKRVGINFRAKIFNLDR